MTKADQALARRARRARDKARALVGQGDRLRALAQALATLETAPERGRVLMMRLGWLPQRRAVAARDLFEAANAVRQRVRKRWRASTHYVRRAFGEGFAASPAKPTAVEALARMVLQGAKDYPESARKAGVGAPTLRRIKRLLDALVAITNQRAKLLAERRALREEVAAAVALVEGCGG